MIPDFIWRAGDQEPVFAQILTSSDGSPVNLEGATLALIMRDTGQPAALDLVAVPTAVTPPGYTVPCQIQWSPAEADTAAIAAGGYFAEWSVVFADGTPMTFPTVGVLWILVEESLATAGGLKIGVRPPNKQVGGLLRARTKDKGGKEWGYFIDGVTRPGGTDVEGLIDDALLEILGKVQPIDPTQPPGSAYNAPGSDYEARVRGAVALYAAILVEASYFPEQAKTNGSVAQIYTGLYNSRIKALIAEGETGIAQGLGAGGAGGGGGDSPADAAWSFPANNGGLVGWSTRW